jgi:hypothetical protein
MNFILRRVEPLTRDYWLVSEAKAIRRCLDAPDPDSAMWAAFGLGELVEKARLHPRLLPAVRKKSSQERGLKNENYWAQAGARRWKAVAREVAEAAWRENPHLPVDAVMRRVVAELTRREIVLRNGAVPKERSIRREIEPLRPRRR